MEKKINQMKIGEKAKIKGYEKRGEQYREKLLSMGLTKGAEITLTKYAPMGDPVEITIRDFKLSLRKEEAEILILNGGQDE